MACGQCICHLHTATRRRYSLNSQSHRAHSLNSLANRSVSLLCFDSCARFVAKDSHSCFASLVTEESERLVLNFPGERVRNQVVLTPTRHTNIPSFCHSIVIIIVCVDLMAGRYSCHQGQVPKEPRHACATCCAKAPSRFSIEAAVQGRSDTRYARFCTHVVHIV